MKNTRVLVAVCLSLVVVFGMTAWLVSSVSDLHDRLAKVSPALAVGFVGFAIAAASLCGLAAARLIWKLGRAERAPVKAPEDIVRAADVQAAKAEGVIDK